MAPAEVLLPNGMAWREGLPLVYFVDSGEERITAYQTDAQVGGGAWEQTEGTCGAVGWLGTAYERLSAQAG